jgi:heptosyltransferase II
MAAASHPSTFDHSAPRRILVRGANWLGDAVMTLPALLRLREYFPDAHITLLCPEKLGDLWLTAPKPDPRSGQVFSQVGQPRPPVNETITFAPGESLVAVARKLRRGKFDLALVLPNSPRSALEVFLARIPQRIGYARPWRNFFLTQVIPSRPDAVKMRKRTVEEIHELTEDTEPAELEKPPGTGNPRAHQIYEYLQITGALGADPEPLTPQLTVTNEEMEAARKKFGLPDDSKGLPPVFGLNPGAEYGPAKRWPVEKFIAAAQAIQNRTNCLWLVFGGKNDISLAGQITTALGDPATAFNLAGKTSLRELMALFKYCRVLLTNDTGPMHVAAALGTPVVALFGSTSPILTGPGLPGAARHRLLTSDVPCSPCFLRECPIDFRCLNGLSVARVVEAVIQSVR